MIRVIRMSAFVRKELVEILRQPKLLLILVLGPFLVLGLFGAGLRDDDPPVRTVIVAPQGPLAALAERYAAAQRPPLVITGVLADQEEGLRRLRSGEVDVVVAFPPDPAETVRSGRQATIVFFHDFVDPIETRAAELAAQQAVDRINAEVSRGMVARGQEVAAEVRERLADARTRTRRLSEAVRADNAGLARLQVALLERDLAQLTLRLGATAGLVRDLGGRAAPGGDRTVVGALTAATEQVDAIAALDDPTTVPGSALASLEADLARLTDALEAFGGVPPEVLASPFRPVARRADPGRVGLTGFYAPAVVVLLVQHMVLSFVSLSIVREESLGTTELFRVAPLTAGEVLAGKLAAYLLLGGVVTAAITTLLIAGLGVPMRGSWALLVLTAAAVLLAAIALGFCIALIADTDTQAVQYAMLVLLASIFFSGFVLNLERFVPPLDAVSYVLPARYGVAAFRAIMLQGDAVLLPTLSALGLMSAILLGMAGVLLQRRLGSV